MCEDLKAAVNLGNAQAKEIYEEVCGDQVGKK
jgi:hypothetical protein